MWCLNNTINFIYLNIIVGSMVIETLRKIGLSEGEIKIYSALLDLGSSPVSRIHERTGIERRNIYDIINKLIRRGLVTYTLENKRKSFQLAHPKNIVGYLEQKKHDLATIESELQKEIPDLVKKFEFTKSAINSETFRGVEGIKAVWEDMLTYKEIRWIGSGRYIPMQHPSFFASWNRRRIKSKIRMFNIFRYELRNELKKLFELEYGRYLPKEWSGNPVVIGIYGNKVVNFLLGKEFFAFVIESEEITANYKKYFEFIWNDVAKKE